MNYTFSQSNRFPYTYIQIVFAEPLFVSCYYYDTLDVRDSNQTTTVLIPPQADRFYLIAMYYGIAISIFIAFTYCIGYFVRLGHDCFMFIQAFVYFGLVYTPVSSNITEIYRSVLRTVNFDLLWTFVETYLPKVSESTSMSEGLNLIGYGTNLL